MAEVGWRRLDSGLSVADPLDPTLPRGSEPKRRRTRPAAIRLEFDTRSALNLRSKNDSRVSDVMRHTVSLIATVILTISTAQAAALCASLPDNLSNVPVANISSLSELNRIDDRLVDALSPCLSPASADAIKAVCSFGEIAAQQTLRIVARIDTAGKRNEVLKNAKLKAYAFANRLLDDVERLRERKQCKI